MSYIAPFSIHEVSRKTRLRWFLQRDGEIHFDRGFRTKADANRWIESFGERLDWRVGGFFRLKGDTCDMGIVNRRGKPVPT